MCKEKWLSESVRWLDMKAILICAWRRILWLFRDTLLGIKKRWWERSKTQWCPFWTRQDRRLRSPHVWMIVLNKEIKKMLTLKMENWQSLSEFRIHNKMMHFLTFLGNFSNIRILSKPKTSSKKWKEVNKDLTQLTRFKLENLNW